MPGSLAQLLVDPGNLGLEAARGRDTLLDQGRLPQKHRTQITKDPTMHGFLWSSGQSERPCQGIPVSAVRRFPGNTKTLLAP